MKILERDMPEKVVFFKVKRPDHEEEYLIVSTRLSDQEKKKCIDLMIQS